MQNRLTVTIAGQKFSLVADESEAYMKEIAALADRKIEEAKKLVGNTAFSTGVLATLNMADEAVKLRHQCEDYRKKSKAQQQEITRQKDELKQIKEELDTMRCARPDEDPAVLLAEIKRLEKELEEVRGLHDTVCAESDAEMARLNAQIEELNQTYQQAQTKLSEVKPLEDKVEALTRQAEELREALKRAHEEKKAAVHEQENSLQSEIDQLNAALDALHVQESAKTAQAQQKIQNLEREVKELRTTRVDPEPLYAEIKNLQTALDAKEEQVSENIELKAQVEDLKKQIE